MHCEAPSDSQRPRGHWLHGNGFSTSRYSVFHGDHTLESLAPKITTHFLASAAAMCVGPVSLPRKKHEPASRAINSRRSSESMIMPLAEFAAELALTRSMGAKCFLTSASIVSSPGPRFTTLVMP